MTDKELLNNYKSLVPFLAELLGPNSEVVLHDVSRPSKSIIAISNAEKHTKRTVGSPLTDFAKEMLHNKEYKNKSYLLNYSGVSKGKTFTSSTFFIKNNKRIIGLLCINRDMQFLKDYKSSFESLMKRYNLKEPSENMTEKLESTQVKSIVNSMVHNTLSNLGVAPERLSKDEKMSIVKQLKEQGAFDTKGSVAEISKKMHISVPTLYRYIKQLT